MDALSYEGETVLHYAYSKIKSQKPLFMFLLDAGASPNVRSKQSMSVQFEAFFIRDDEIGEMIQDKYKGDINSQESNGRTLIHLALIDKDYDRMEYFIKRKASLEVKDNEGRTMFMTAIISHSLDICKRLLDLGARIDSHDKLGNTPFMYVCSHSPLDKERFHFLLDNGCNFNTQNNEKEFPMSHLINFRFFDEVQILLDKGALINDKRTKHEPICCALRIKNQEMIEKLFKYGANALNT